jgi:hypothetical protein
MIYSVLTKLTKAANDEDTKDNKNKYVSIPEDLFRHLLAAAIKQKGLFDEKFYLTTYPDVAKAIKTGDLASGLQHYIATGYFEGRSPKKLIVDERFYLQENPDVADAIRRGQLRNAQEHFEATGFREGRAPYRGFSVF